MNLNCVLRRLVALPSHDLAGGCHTRGHDQESHLPRMGNYSGRGFPR